ncbi:acetyl-CoA carboxylase biotin carboxyl carrier protein [Streptosporangium roseum]|uniref:acetyl-CoA carboxylase biotin carboxyl carrier protein n=1 Tax=Streptosporangium roseum TaxID=2001 RepID=UPI0004CD5E30|nr:biotin/lipoyl-containing protein [Streptosporangium roseum]
MNNESTGAVPSGIDELCRQAANLIEAAKGPLKSVRVQAGDLLVQVEWPEPGPAPNMQAAPNGQAVAWGRPEAAAPDGPESAPGEDDGAFVVHAPLVGTFYHAPSPGAPPFAAVGDEMVAGQQMAIVEAMKLMNAVEVDRPGRVVEVLVPDGSPVEYGEALFVLAPV